MRANRSSEVSFWIPEERLNILDRIIDELCVLKRTYPHMVINSEKNLTLMKDYFRMQLDPKQIQCMYAQKTLLIANDGSVTTCYGAFGHVKSSSLQDIWRSGEAHQARMQVQRCQKPCLLPCFTDYEVE